MILMYNHKQEQVNSGFTLHVCNIRWRYGKKCNCFTRLKKDIYLKAKCQIENNYNFISILLTILMFIQVLPLPSDKIPPRRKLNYVNLQLRLFLSATTDSKERVSRNTEVEEAS